MSTLETMETTMQCSSEICDAIFTATEETINEGKCLTYDLGGSSSLSQMANEIANKSKTHLSQL